jgi:8-oxo-dGTP pyrophosphatase MutT (NUDIX family)
MAGPSHGAAWKLCDPARLRDIIADIQNGKQRHKLRNDARYVIDPSGRRYFGDRGGAGCLVLSRKTGRLMLIRRSDNVEEAGTWGTVGGAIEDGSNPARTAADELLEETGYDGPVRMVPLGGYQSPGGAFSFHNFLGIVDDEFEPWESHESAAHRWFELGDWPEPMHFGVEHILADTESIEAVTTYVARAKKGEDLLAAGEAAERTLYHCLYREPEGDALQPTYRGTINGREGTYLFAATHFTKALAFAFSYHDREVAGNGAIEGTPDEFVIVCRRTQTLSAPRHVRVYSFGSECFEPVAKSNSRQCVSERPVAFRDTRLIFEARGIDALMHHGLQIFSTDKTLEELMSGGFCEPAGSGRKSTVDLLRDLVRSEGFTWENREREINPNSVVMRAVETGQHSAALAPHSAVDDTVAASHTL